MFFYINIKFYDIIIYYKIDANKEENILNKKFLVFINLNKSIYKQYMDFFILKWNDKNKFKTNYKSYEYYILFLIK